MRAVVIREFGPPDRLEPEELTTPVPGAGEVLVDVELANVTFVETQVRAGRPPRPEMAPALPAVLGNGVGGVIARVGAGVDPALVGRRVVSSLRGTGGYAEHAVAAAAAAIDVPETVALGDAVAVLADGRTALGVLRAAQLQPGETALVLAAGGGVGSLLVQLARDAGARVVAGAGAERKLELARSLGARLALDYTRDGWATQAGAVDVVFDGVGGTVGRAALAQLRPGGRLARFGMASGTFTSVTDDDRTAGGVSVLSGSPSTPEQLRELTREALELVATGRLRPTIGQTFTLKQACRAHAAIESRSTVGKTLLVVR